MTPHEIAVSVAWKSFLASRPGTHAVTLMYNPQHQGTVSPCYRIAQDGECLRLPTPGIPTLRGANRLPTARYIPLEQVHRDTDKLHRTVDRKLFGTRYSDRKEGDRSGFVGWIEHPDTNIHVHLSWRVPECRANEFPSVVTDAWMATSRFASIHVESIRDDGWIKYILKDQWGSALNGDAALFVASRSTRS
jgi:hypothetical protein